MSNKSFPEKTHSKHAPDGDGSKPAYIKGSHKVGAGHEAYDNRMPHPFGIDAPMSESGEGQNK